MASLVELKQLLLEQTQDHTIILLDPGGKIVGWFGGAEYIFGYTASEIIGKFVGVLFTPEDQERGVHHHELAVAASHGRAEDDRWQVRKDGTRIWAGGVVTQLRDASGTLVGFGKVLRDRTDVKAQIDALANAAERQKVFLGTLAHELRNPLAPLSNAIQIIRMNPASNNLAAPLQILERSVKFMQRLLDDLMDLTRVGAGKVNLRLQPTHLEDVLTRAAEACRSKAEEHGHLLKILLLPTPTTVWADPDRLQQVAVNLLTNAIKYTPDGGEVWLKATVEGSEAVFRVEDSGLGIEPDMLPKIFELFTQEESSLTRSQGGLGLGLPLVKELVSLHGGTVQVRSEGRGKGSEFTVRLPLHRGSDEPSK